MDPGIGLWAGNARRTVSEFTSVGLCLPRDGKEGHSQ